jgi:hypothetical protein
MSHRLSRITKVNPREVWKHEALNFTKWLALEEKIAILCEELEFNLENVTAEAATDKLYVDSMDFAKAPESYSPRMQMEIRH